MFYLLKRVDEKQFTLGDRVMLLADFPTIGLKAGSIVVVSGIYEGGVMIEWTRNDGYGSGKIDREGFGRDELEYLAVETSKHPKML